MQTKLIILGAGCSLNRYPLANKMLAHLKEFANALGEEATRLRKLVEQTVGLFDRLRAKGIPADTLDDLARSIHSGQLPASDLVENFLQNYRVVEEAKVVVAALFLSKEADALGAGLAGYRSLMRRILSSSFGTDRNVAMKNTPYRVLTFNYYRLFELAFRQFCPYDGTEAFYGPTVLNSGLYQVLPKRVEIDLNRFSFLKLHGSAGLYSYEDAGECHHYHGVPDPNRPTPITDAEFFVPAGRGVHSDGPKPALIVFPHEKDLLRERPDNVLSFRSYIPAVWKAARHFASQASEIWLVGYSCPEPDFAAWSSLITAATSCEQVVVWNPSAGEICDRLRVRLPEQASLFKGVDRSFAQF